MSDRNAKLLRKVARELALPIDFFKGRYKRMNWKERTSIMASYRHNEKRVQKSTA